jgi:hypothetical protein
MNGQHDDQRPIVKSHVKRYDEVMEPYRVWAGRTAEAMGLMERVMDDAFGPEDEESAQPELGTRLGTFCRTSPRKSVELRGFEPLTFCMPCRRATSCAIAPQPNSQRAP